MHLTLQRPSPIGSSMIHHGFIMILSKTLDVSPDSLPPEIFPNYLCFCTREFPPSGDVQFELDDLEGAEANLVMAVEKTDAKGFLDSLEGAKILQKLGDLQTELNGYQD